MMGMFSSWIVIMVVQYCKLTKNYFIIHLKQLDFMIYNSQPQTSAQQLKHFLYGHYLNYPRNVKT